MEPTPVTVTGARAASAAAIRRVRKVSPDAFKLWIASAVSLACLLVGLARIANWQYQVTGHDRFFHTSYRTD